jgi:23S rRNA (uracil1939-C5)-methyltransferase
LKDGLGLGVGEVLVDAFCGVGTLGLPLVGPEAKLIGIEQHQASIERAQDNARLNNIDNAEFLVGSVEQKLAEVLPVTDALLLDPPRKGLSDPLINIIQGCPPDRIAYVSCNPSTLARDLSRLCADGMLELLSVQPLDFFPQTTHCEALALLKRVAVR